MGLCLEEGSERSRFTGAAAPALAGFTAPAAAEAVTSPVCTRPTGLASAPDVSPFAPPPDVSESGGSNVAARPPRSLRSEEHRDCAGWTVPALLTRGLRPALAVRVPQARRAPLSLLVTSTFQVSMPRWPRARARHRQAPGTTAQSVSLPLPLTSASADVRSRRPRPCLAIRRAPATTPRRGRVWCALPRSGVSAAPRPLLALLDQPGPVARRKRVRFDRFSYLMWTGPSSAPSRRICKVDARRCLAEQLASHPLTRRLARPLQHLAVPQLEPWPRGPASDHPPRGGGGSRPVPRGTSAPFWSSRMNLLPSSRVLRRQRTA